jgi:hypothetical protein
VNRACITLAVVTGIEPDVWAELGWRGIATALEVLDELYAKGGNGGDLVDEAGRVMGG